MNMRYVSFSSLVIVTLACSSSSGPAGPTLAGTFSATTIRGQPVPTVFCMDLADPPVAPVMIIADSIRFNPATATVDLDYVVSTNPCAGNNLPDTTRFHLTRAFRQSRDTVFVEHPYTDPRGVPSPYVDTGTVASDTVLVMSTHVAIFAPGPLASALFRYRRQ